MKNIIKIVGSALVATLVLGNVAIAAPGTGLGGSTSAPSTGNGGTTSGNSVPSTGNGGSTGGNSVPSTGNGGSTAGNPSTPSDGGNGGSNGGSTGGSSGGSTSSGRSGGSVRNVSLTNVNVSVVGNKATVTWDTTPASRGMIVYGPLSLATPTNATSFYGYAAGTEVSDIVSTHSHTFTMASGITYFVRPVAFVGARAVFASEVKINSTTGTNVLKTNAPAVGTIFDAPAKTIIDSKIPSDVEVSKATTTNVAAVAKSNSKIGSFFKKIWNSIISPFCK